MTTDQVQTFVCRGPSESLVKRCQRRGMSFRQFQIDGVVERQTVSLGQGECDVHIGTNGQVIQSVQSLRRSVCGKSASPDCDKEAVAQFQMR